MQIQRTGRVVHGRDNKEKGEEKGVEMRDERRENCFLNEERERTKDEMLWFNSAGR